MEMTKMAERKKYDPALVKVGELITEKRKALGDATNLAKALFH